jgi:hypothetical protein
MTNNQLKELVTFTANGINAHIPADDDKVSKSTAVFVIEMTQALINKLKQNIGS